MIIQPEAVADGSKTLVEETETRVVADNATIQETKAEAATAIRAAVSEMIQETRVAAIATRAVDSRNAINIS